MGKLRPRGQQGLHKESQDNAGRSQAWLLVQCHVFSIWLPPPDSSVPRTLSCSFRILPKGVNLVGMLFPVRLMKNSWTVLTHPIHTPF